MKRTNTYDKLMAFNSKVEELKDLVNDLDTRDKHYVVNCKVYEWLDDSDLDTVIKKLGLSPRATVLVKAEFGDDRLNGINYHTQESESDYFKEFMQGCATDNYRKRANTYGTWLDVELGVRDNLPVEFREVKRGGKVMYHSADNGRFKYHYEEFKIAKEAGFTRDSLWAKYQEENADSILEWEYLDFFDMGKYVYQFGRSGGWISFAEEGSYDKFFEGYHGECGSLYECIEEAQKQDGIAGFWQKLIELSDSGYHGYEHGSNAKEIIGNAESHIADIQFTIDAIEWFKARVKAIVDGWKDALMSRLEDEVDNFLVDSNENIADRIKAGMQRLDTITDVLPDSMLKTNQSAHVPLKVVWKLIADFEGGKDIVGEKVGEYTITQHLEVEKEHYFKIGCHVVKLSEIKNKVTELVHDNAKS
jgi:hypothetical protein